MNRIIKVAKNYKGEANYAISNVTTALVSMLSGLVAAAFIAPEDLGVIQALLLIQTYAVFLNFGVFSGLNRNLAFYKAKGDLDTMQKEIDTSHTVSVVISVIGAFIGIGVILYHIFIGSTLVYIWSGVLLLVLLIVSPLTTHVECTFRSSQQFGRFGWIKNIQSAIYAVISLLPILLGYIGRVISNGTNQVIGLLLRLRYIPYKHKGKGDLTSLKDLISSGLPIMINGYIFSVFEAADRTYIASNMTSYNMGLYTIAGYCLTMIYIIPAAVGTMLYPKATAKYGETGDKRSLIPLWWKSMLLFLTILIPIMVTAYFAMPPLVRIFMPKYVDGIIAGKIAIITTITYVSYGPSVIFGTLKKNKVYTIAIVTSLALFWTVTTVWHDTFQTIESVAILRGVIALMMAIFVIVYSYWLIRK